MWINDVGADALKTVLKHSSAMILISKVNGQILWANDAFCEWSQYTLRELMQMTWIQLSVSDDDLKADIAMALSMDEYNLSYTVQKRYIPKNSKPQIGNMHVVRYPAQGDIEFCFCRWEPLVNGTAQALELALASQKKVTQEVAELTQKIRSIADQSEEQRFTLALVSMVSKYPKISLAIVVTMLSLSGFDVVLSTLQRLGYVQAPPVVIQTENKSQ